MPISSATIMAPSKVALSRHERFLASACRACRANWGGVAIFLQDGLLREHLITGLSTEQATAIRLSPAWTEALRLWRADTNHQGGPLNVDGAVPDLQRGSKGLAVSWPIAGSARVVLYVIRTSGEPFGAAETATLQALSQLLAQESQQDESHLSAKLRVLNQIAQAAASLHDLQALFSLTLSELERHIPWQCEAIWLCDEAHATETSEMTPPRQVQLVSCSERALQFGLAKDMALDIEESIFLRCMDEGTATYVDAAELAAAECPLAQAFAQGGVSASFAVPLRAGQRFMGILQCLCVRSGGFTNEQIQLFYLVADLLGPAIGQALWQERLINACNELRAAQAQLVQSEKIRALGEMASGMAHDFNNALCGVLGFLDLALLEKSLPQTCREYLESSKTCALDAAQTVRRVQEFARRHRAEGELQPLNLDDLVQQTVVLTRPKWETLTQLDKPITAEVNTTSACCVHGNPSELREALTNLIFNAVDAMPHGGKLTIRTWTEGSDALLAVQDTGIGISDDARRRLFEPFFTTKGERGTGLGLSVTFGIVQRHGGHITVASSPGKGSTFTVRLPIHTEAAQEVAGTDPLIDPSNYGSQVLVVEDEESIRRFLTAGLEALGYRLQTALTAEEALDVLKSQQFDVILTDLGLPGMSGAELARTVQQRAPGTPVVLLTGWGEQLQAENRQIEGVVEILAKPVTIKKLATTLASICAI